MNQTVDIEVLVPNWGYWNGKTTELLTKGDVRKSVDRDMAGRAAARGEVKIIEDKPVKMAEPPKAIEPEEETVEETTNAAVKEDLESMTVAKLKTYAKDHGIDLGDAKKKADIVAAIFAALED